MKPAPKVFHFCFLVATAVFPSVALGADPTTAGSTNIGTHPGYGASYSGFWRTGLDYSLLTDGVNSFVNAPSSSGGLYFRAANSDRMSLTSNGLYLNSNRLRNDAIWVGDGSFPLGVGRHPWYGAPYLGIWVQGACGNCATSDYSFLTNGQDTYLNAPSDGGSLWFRGANSDRMRLTASTLTLYGSTAEKPGGGPWSGTSDIRVKKDIRDLRYGLNDLEQVRPVIFKYNGLGETSESDTEFVGVIAQELEQSLPFMVSSEKKKLHRDDEKPTSIKRVDPNAFTYILINAVKQLSAKNKQMKKILCMDHPTESFCSGSGVALR